MNIYRAYRMENLYAPSLDGFTRCSSQFFSDNSLYTPIVDIGGTFVELQMVLDTTAEDLRFRIIRYQVLTDISAFNGRDMAYQTFDGVNHSLTLPDLAFGLNHYRVRMVLVQGPGAGLWFKVEEARKK